MVVSGLRPTRAPSEVFTSARTRPWVDRPIRRPAMSLRTLTDTQSPTLARTTSGWVRLGLAMIFSLFTLASVFLRAYIRPLGSLSPQPLRGMVTWKAARSYSIARAPAGQTPLAGVIGSPTTAVAAEEPIRAEAVITATPPAATPLSPGHRRGGVGAYPPVTSSLRRVPRTRPARARRRSTGNTRAASMAP